jgi:hypothetical protein
MPELATPCHIARRNTTKPLAATSFSKSSVDETTHTSSCGERVTSTLNSGAAHLGVLGVVLPHARRKLEKQAPFLVLVRWRIRGRTVIAIVVLIAAAAAAATAPVLAALLPLLFARLEAATAATATATRLDELGHLHAMRSSSTLWASAATPCTSL